MINAKDSRKRGYKPVLYGADDEDKAFGGQVLAEDTFKYMASCPICERRVFDVSNLPGDAVRVRLKCPHCRNIVRIPISAMQEGQQVT